MFNKLTIVTLDLTTDTALRSSLVLLAFSLTFLGCKPEPVKPTTEKPKGWVYDATPYILEFTDSFPTPLIPVDNQLTKKGVELGRHLFYDPVLSEGNTQSCASCHGQAFGFTDNGVQFSKGVDGIQGERNAMPLFNLAWDMDFFWDGRASTLEEQILEPVENPIEMHEEWPDAILKLQQDTNYQRMFYQTFELDSAAIDRYFTAKAIAQFLRSIVSDGSYYAKYLRGDLFVMPNEDAVIRGRDLFFKDPPEGGVDCWHCHGENRLFKELGDISQTFSNNGLQSAITLADFNDIGLGGVTNDPTDYGKFKVPTLLNIALTGPYMHDGRFATLEEVIEFYNSGINENSPNIAPELLQDSLAFGLNMTQQDKDDLLAFLNSLTDNDMKNNPAYASPF